LDEPAGGGDGVETRYIEGLLGLADDGVGTFERRGEQLLLAAEVVVDHPLRRPGTCGDLVDASPRVADAGELGRRHLANVGAGTGGVTHTLGLPGGLLLDGGHRAPRS